MASNANLSAAREAKNDEFYTLYEDVKTEVMKYYSVNNDIFRGKIILCPCDDADSSFYKFFDDNFDKFGIKKLFCSRYYEKMNGESHGKYFVIENTKNEKIYYSDELQGDGDFRSKEVKALFSQADYIITNPPFSLFRSFIKQVMDYDKKFLIIGNMNAITYKEIFPLLKDNKIWLGYNHPKEFRTPNGKIQKFGNIMWFTNLDIPKRNESIVLCKRFYDNDGKQIPGAKEIYPKLDNYDAINVDAVADIPYDYMPCWYECENANICDYAKKEGNGKAKPLCEKYCNGKIAVPITIFEKHFWRDFDYSLENKIYHGIVNGDVGYARVIIRQEKPKKMKSNLNIIYKNIKDLVPYENNPRKNDNAVDAVAESIKQFGWKVPVVIDKDNVIVAGHTRYKAAQKLGITEVPCIVADDLTEEQVTAFRIADNKVSEYAEWDYELLKNELSEIKIDMKPLGMSLSEIPSYDELFTEAEPKDKETKKRVYTCPCCGKEFEL